jgi:3-isopropylmalate/(R)-2-methylmalate dehydratase small subunit
VSGVAGAAREPWQTLRGRAVVLDLVNIDTDQIIPARFLRKPRSEGFHHYLFHSLRRTPDGALRADFPLNAPTAAGAQVLVAGDNFGCGSSREGAVYALVDAGFRAVVAAGFGDIFAGNALKNGLLPVRLPADVVAALMQALQAGPGLEVTVDLEAQQVAWGGAAAHAFEVDPFAREMLLAGTDEIGLTLASVAQIEAFERRRGATPMP